MEDSRRALLLASGLALATALAARASVPLAAAIAALSTLAALQRWLFPAGLAAHVLATADQKLACAAQRASSASASYQAGTSCLW